MFKTALIFVAVVATAVAVLAEVPKLHTNHKNGVVAPVKDSRLIQVQTCDAGCANCKTVVEYQANQCHNDRRIFSRGEILECRSVPPTRTCFRETMFNASGGAGCNGPKIQSAVRECNVCTQDVFPFGTFSKVTGCGTVNMTVHRGCDYNCKNCGIIFPVSKDKCMQFHQHANFHDVAFQNGPEFACGGSGWTDIRADHFAFPTCDGEPDFVDYVFTQLCYEERGRFFQFNCA